MNYAEELACWYFRLNGFFPIPNWVVHRDGDSRYPADADLLAVRLPYVHEEIGGNSDDWDKRFAQQWGVDLLTDTIGIIAEVKSGHCASGDLGDALGPKRTRKGMLRMGLLERHAVMDIPDQELTSDSIRRQNKVILRFLIARSKSRTFPAGAFHFLELNEIERFLKKRLKQYADTKNADRVFFPSSLMQYLIAKTDRT